MTISATFRHPKTSWWRRPSGPWDPERVGTIDDLFPDDVAVAAAAGGLRAAGVRRGDPVAWQLPNGEEAVTLFRACWRLGAVAVPIHHQAGAADAEAIVSSLGARVVERAPSGPPVWLDRSIARPADAAVVLHTSGSSGRPKGAIHTHRSLAHKARVMVAVHGLGVDDTVLMPAPLAHISGLLNGVLVAGAAGMRSVLMPRWDPEEALARIQADRVTFMIGPPTFFTDLMAARGFRSSRVASLRVVSCGGAGVSTAFVAEAAARLGARVKRTYGSTEAPTITTWREGDDPERAATTDGRPVGEVEMRLDPDGELQVRGPELFAGYTDETATRAAFAPGGWFRTGDRATIDDGWVTITGRADDLIIRGGENVDPSEVEAVLEAHPAVRQAVVVGVPDGRLGQRVAAAVVCAAGAAPFDLAECRRWAEARGLARFKIPERVDVVDAIPVLASGKPDRAVVHGRVKT